MIFVLKLLVSVLPTINKILRPISTYVKLIRYVTLVKHIEKMLWLSSSFQKLSRRTNSR